MPGRVTVITYHGVGDCARSADPYRLWMPVRHFRQHMEFLARHRCVVGLDEVCTPSPSPSPSPKPAVAITFDDGYRSILETAMPLLQAHGFPATIFVPSGWLGRDMGWEPMAANHRPLPIVSGDELAAFERGGIRVASHGHAHVRLGEVTDEDIDADLSASVATLSGALGRHPGTLAYPFGSHSPAARQAARRAGFRAAFSIGQRRQGRFAEERVTIRPDDSLPLFAFKTSGHYLGLRTSPLIDVAFEPLRRRIAARRARN
jgi:peptidoglycan/xylan/chitin deacetylase (PgdA/CDA1 family)